MCYKQPKQFDNCFLQLNLKIQNRVLQCKMSDTFLVDGYIDNGLGGKHFTLGIFNNRENADTNIVKFLKTWNCKYVINRDGVYIVTYLNDNCYYDFDIRITRYSVNEINTLHLMKSD